MRERNYRTTTATTETVWIRGTGTMRIDEVAFSVALYAGRQWRRVRPARRAREQEHPQRERPDHKSRQVAVALPLPPCPRCEASDRVFQVLYGLVSGPRSDESRFVFGGCIHSAESATHYCERCDLAFRYAAATHTSVIVGGGDDW